MATARTRTPVCRAVRTILDRRGYRSCGIVAPMVEELSETAADLELLLRAILTGDVVYALPSSRREELAPPVIPTEEDLLSLAGKACAPAGKILAAVGTPLCITSLDEGLLSTLEAEGNTIIRAPLSELLWFLWKDNGKQAERGLMDRVAQALGAASSFSQKSDSLFDTAETYLRAFAGGHGRYHYAKTVELGKRANAVLAMAPRYENSAMILQMQGMSRNCQAPLFEASLDGDWDETSWSRLRSFRLRRFSGAPCVIV